RSLRQLRLLVDKFKTELDDAWIIDIRLVNHAGPAKVSTIQVPKVTIGLKITMAIEHVKEFCPEFERVSFREPSLLEHAQVLAIKRQGPRTADHRWSAPEEHFWVGVVALVPRLGHVRSCGRYIVESRR